MKWEILAEYSKDVDVTEILLKNRGVVTPSERADFLSPPPIPEYFKRLPLDFREGLKTAKDLILSEISKNTPIVIYGDYDSDGINATAILYNVISKELAYPNVTYFIPDRFTHGYGLSREAVEDILKDHDGKFLLFITVDTGITAVEVVDHLKSLGHQVIISDHHQKPENLPKADVLVWSDEMVGASVSWFLGKALGSKDNVSLSFAAVATVTDIFPVKGINRSLVKTGLEILNTTPPLGIKNLLEVAGKNKGNLSTYELGWVLGPRLNATGRLNNAHKSLSLLLETDPQKSRELAMELNSVNSSRQDKTFEMYKIAGLDDKSEIPSVIFSANTEYHEGIIGLVASRLTQKYYRPSIVIALNDDHGKGSVRSIPGINIIEALRNFSELFEELGGHPMAAGFYIKKENIEKLETSLKEYLEKNVSKETFTPEILVDMKIPLTIVDLDLLSKVETLKPFGVGNTEPQFCSENLTITDVNYVGKEANHMSLRLISGEKTAKAIYFDGREKFPDLALGDKIDLVYTLGRNEYNGKTYLDLVVKDLRRTINE